MKKTDTVYDYLERLGVLSTGSPEDIVRAKETYWKLRRKEWRKHQRQNCKSCTIFFTFPEYHAVRNAIPDKRKNVTRYVKQATLNAALNKQSIGKELVGKVRETFFEAYATIDRLAANNDVKNVLIKLEQKILLLIQ